MTIPNLFPRLIGTILLGLGGWPLGVAVGNTVDFTSYVPLGLAGTLIGVVVGAIATPYVSRAFIQSTVNASRNISTARFAAASLGLVAGLVIAILISFPFSRIPGWPGVWLPIVLNLLFATAGAAIAVSRERDLLPFLSQAGNSQAHSAASNGKIVLDTSAIIDGRIADISESGFINGALVIPRFVLDELRHIADSSDSLRRNRGRRGLEMLNKLRKESSTPVQVTDVDHWNGMEVDAKLVMLAESLNAPIVTTDFNLNRVAEIQGVHVLNINELANALKSVVLPGEEMSVHVIQQGKEAGQGVGFLDDGTMVVVEGGRVFLDSTVEVAVTRVLQTAAGRLIFAQPRAH